LFAVGLHTCTAVARYLCVSWAFLYYCIIMLSNVASTPLSCDRLLSSLFTVHNFTKTLVRCVSVITTEQSAVTLNTVMYRVLAILNFSHWQFLTNFEVKIFMCIVHLTCVGLFHYFRIFSSFIVCIFRGVKIRPRWLGAPECRGGGRLVHCTTAQPIATPLIASLFSSCHKTSNSLPCSDGGGLR